MKKPIVLFLILLGCFCSAATAQTKKHHHKHTTHQPYSLVDPSANYADIVIDAKTGQILHASNANVQCHPASLTKMMTLYMTFEALQTGRLSLYDKVPISAKAAEQEPSKLGLRPGQDIQVRDAILGVVTESANDVAVALAEKLGGTETNFAHLMTAQAHALGMAQTHFDNPSGLPDSGQVTTAHDMAILAQDLIYHFPQYYPYFRNSTFTYKGIEYRNHNHLMSHYTGMDGIKTGYIRASGFNLVASAVRGDTRLIGVIFGGRTSEARDNQMAILLDQAFAEAEKDRLNTARDINTTDSAQDKQPALPTKSI